MKAKIIVVIVYVLLGFGLWQQHVKTLAYRRGVLRLQREFAFKVNHVIDNQNVLISIHADKPE